MGLLAGIDEDFSCGCGAVGVTDTGYAGCARNRTLQTDAAEAVILCGGYLLAVVVKVADAKGDNIHCILLAQRLFCVENRGGEGMGALFQQIYVSAFVNAQTVACAPDHVGTHAHMEAVGD